MFHYKIIPDRHLFFKWKNLAVFSVPHTQQNCAARFAWAVNESVMRSTYRCPRNYSQLKGTTFIYQTNLTRTGVLQYFARVSSRSLLDHLHRYIMIGRCLLGDVTRELKLSYIFSNVLILFYACAASSKLLPQTKYFAAPFSKFGLLRKTLPSSDVRKNIPLWTVLLRGIFMIPHVSNVNFQFAYHGFLTQPHLLQIWEIVQFGACVVQSAIQARVSLSYHRCKTSQSLTALIGALLEISWNVRIGD